VVLKDTKLNPGTLVTPKKDTVYLTPLDPDLAEDFENWIEWSVGQVGIVLDSCISIGLRIITSRGMGTCFNDEIIEVNQPLAR